MEVKIICQNYNINQAERVPHHKVLARLARLTTIGNLTQEACNDEEGLCDASFKSIILLDCLLLTCLLTLDFTDYCMMHRF